MRQHTRIEAVVRRRLGTAQDVYRRGGVGAVALKVLLLLGYHRIILFEAILNPPAPPPPAGVPLEVGFLARDALDEIAAFRSDLSRTELEERFDRDERCFVARSEGEIVSALWVHRHNVMLPGVGYELVVPADAVYVCDSFTAPAIRGQRIAPALSRELKNRLVAEGVERWVSYVLGGNDVGLLNAARGGSRETSRVAAVKIGPLPPVRVPYVPRRARA